MAGVVKGMEGAMRAMDLEKVGTKLGASSCYIIQLLIIVIKDSSFLFPSHCSNLEANIFLASRSLP